MLSSISTVFFNFFVLKNCTRFKITVDIDRMHVSSVVRSMDGRVSSPYTCC